MSKNILSKAKSELINNIYDEIKKYILQVNIVSIDVSSRHYSYSKVNSIIRNLNKNKYDKYMEPCNCKKNIELCNNILYMIKFSKGNYARISTYTQLQDDYYIKHIKIDIIGNKRYKYKNMIMEKCSKAGLNDKILIYGTYFNSYVDYRNFSDIIIEHDKQKRIINGLKRWSDSKEWYKEHGIVHKIGVLLYGEPGTGKSALVKCISHMFKNAPIVIFDSNIRSFRDRINDLRESHKGTIIVLMEDCDMLFTNRNINSDKNNNTAVDDEDSNNSILQVLDGVYSTDNTIYIATTNYRNRLDDAFVRHGRFDIQEELKYFDYNRSLKFLKLFGYDKKVLDEIDITFPVQPAMLQSKIMEYRSSMLSK